MHGQPIEAPTADDNCCLSHICAGLMPQAKLSIFNVYTYHWWQVWLAKALVETDSTQFLEAASHNWEDTACVPVNRTDFFMYVCGAQVVMHASNDGVFQTEYSVSAPGVMSPQCGAVLHVLHGSGLSPLLPLV